MTERPDDNTNFAVLMSEVPTSDLGIEPHHIEAALNHFSGHRRGVAGTYNRSTYGGAIATALACWAEHVLALVEGRENQVVPLQRA